MNKYLEKIALHPPAKHYARAAADIIKKNPLTFGFGIGGALDGANTTARRANETTSRYVSRIIPNVVVGAGKGAAGGKATELGLRYLKRQALKDFEKGANEVVKAWKEAGPLAKISLGMSAGSLGIGSTNLFLGQVRASRQAKTNEVAGKQLGVLNRIHKTLSDNK